MNYVATHHLPTTDQWESMLWRIRNEKCVPFLGAGASLGTADHPGLPTAAVLAEDLARICNYPGPDKSDLLRIGQYFSLVKDPRDLQDMIVSKLRQRKVVPSVVHETLANLPLPLVLTTNFDELMEQAFKDAGKAPTLAVYDVHGDKTDLPRPTVNEPLVYKLHGCVTRPHTIAATEDGVIEFLSSLMRGEPGLPGTIKQMFALSSLIFIGYGLKDWNVRVMLRAFRGWQPGRSQERSVDLSSYAVQKRPDNDALAIEWQTAVMYLDRREGIQCFDMDANAFATELKRRYDAGEGIR